MRAVRLRGAALVLACAAALVGCSDDGGGGDVTTSKEPVEVEVGETFSWNGFVVEDGWTIEGVKRSAGVDEVTTPEVKGTIKNTSEEERAAIFQMVFSADGEPISTLNCSARTMVEDQSQQFICPGLNTTMPKDYDAVVVQEFTR